MDARPDAVESLEQRHAVYRCAAGHETGVAASRYGPSPSTWECRTCGKPAAWHSGKEPGWVRCKGREEMVDELTTFQAEAGGRYCHPCAERLLEAGGALTRPGTLFPC